MVVKGQKWSRSRLRDLLLAVSSQEVLYPILRDKTQVVQQFGENNCASLATSMKLSGIIEFD